MKNSKKYSIECVDGRFLCIKKGEGRKYREGNYTLFNENGKQVFFKYFTTKGRAESWVKELNERDAVRYDLKTNKRCFNENYKWFIKESEEK